MDTAQTNGVAVGDTVIWAHEVHYRTGKRVEREQGRVFEVDAQKRLAHFTTSDEQGRTVRHWARWSDLKRAV